VEPKSVSLLDTVVNLGREMGHLGSSGSSNGE